MKRIAILTVLMLSCLSATAGPAAPGPICTADGEIAHCQSPFTWLDGYLVEYVIAIGLGWLF